MENPHPLRIYTSSLTSPTGWIPISGPQSPFDVMRGTEFVPKKVEAWPVVEQVMRMGEVLNFLAPFRLELRGEVPL